ncbi:GNAT family N-acetyltransferase [Kiloniella antarctica]|uniref:GNAT family N-acetyltransferase n=1 Tax=Kiloniella antarctica TaxID=1550907 RepID=A0ABW5BI08_9PROT
MEDMRMIFKGDDVFYRPLAQDDLPALYSWACDQEVTKYSLSWYVIPKPIECHKTWLAALIAKDTSVDLAICCNETQKIIGYSGITALNLINRCGEFYILIGEQDYWGRGIATEATKIITEYGFKNLGLHRVELTAFADNPAAITAYKKAGFIHEGIKRQSGFRDGQYRDKVMMSALSSEWMK